MVDRIWSSVCVVFCCRRATRAGEWVSMKVMRDFSGAHRSDRPASSEVMPKRRHRALSDAPVGYELSAGVAHPHRRPIARMTARRVDVKSICAVKIAGITPEGTLASSGSTVEAVRVAVPSALQET